MGWDKTMTHFDVAIGLGFFFFEEPSFFESDRFMIAFLCLGVLFCAPTLFLFLLVNLHPCRFFVEALFSSIT